MSGSRRARVVLVERDAHRRLGHYPTLFASLARSFAEHDCDVDVLTQQGWLFSDVERDVPFRVHPFGPLVARLDRRVRDLHARVNRVARRYPSAPRVRKATRILSDGTEIASSALAALAVRRWSRSHGAPDLVLVLTFATVPTVFAAVVGDVELLVYAFTPPARRLRRFDDAIGRRPARLARLRVITSEEALAQAWANRLPGVPVEVGKITGTRAISTDAEERTRARRGARDRLGLPLDEALFLLFGAGHPQQLPEVVERAFRRRELDDVGLVVAGAISDRLHSPDEVARLVVRGFVSNEQRHDLFAAANAVVISFCDGFDRESATFADAVSYGLPVVVSRGCLAADAVDRLGIGVVFEPDDEESLVDAIRRTPTSLDDVVIEGAQSELAESSVARSLLSVLSGTDAARTP